MSVFGASFWQVWHSAGSWLKLIVALESVVRNTVTGMFTRLIFR